MDDQVLFEPLTWSVGKEVLKCTGIFQGTRTERVLKIPIGSTKVLLYETELKTEELKEISESYSALKVGTSEVNPKAVIIRNPIISPDESITSTEDQTDPVGVITSFFQSVNIKPYQPFYLKTNSNNNNTIHETEILPSMEKRVHGYRRLYWDIEVVTPRKEFVYAKYIDNHIISISLVFTQGHSHTGEEPKKMSYFLYWGTYDIRNKDFISVKFSNEGDLLRYFYQLVNDLDPDRMYTFNGDSFDIPYLAERTRLHSIKPSRGFFHNKRIKGRFQWETVQVWDLQGVEQIDLLRYALKFLPGLPNYKLETIGRTFLKEGKTGLEIEEMFKSFYIQDPEGMEALAKYSVQDSLLLERLLRILNVDEMLENIANSCGTIISEILNLSNFQLIDRFAYRIDPGSVYMKGSGIPGIPLRSNFRMNRVYRNIYIYDYVDYYSMEMANYSDDFTFLLGEKSIEFPGELKALLYSSKYFPRDPKLDQVKEAISSRGEIMEITPTEIKINRPIEGGAFEYKKMYTHLLYLGKISMAARTSEGEIVTVGTAKILKPNFNLGKDFLIECLRYIFGDLKDMPNIKDFFSEADPTSLVISIKLKNKDEYPYGSKEYLLSEQLENNIQTWATVKYYMTTRGPVMQELISKDDIIDIDYYLDELKDISKILRYK